MKYKEWLNEWLELYAKQSIKQRTYEQYSDVVRRRLIPSLGEYDMDELDARVIQRYIVKLSESGNTKTGKGLSPNSVNSIILVIHSSLSMAYVLGLTKMSCADKIKRPKTIEKAIESFSPEEQKKIERAVLHDKRSKMIGIVLCLYTGLRIGELLALEWDDVDFAKGELYVTKTCYDSKDELGKYCRINSTPKTETSRRIIPLGVVSHRIFHTLIFLLVFVTLRSFTGGYHANSYGICFMVTISIFVVTLLLAEYIHISWWYYCFLLSIGVPIIYVVAPVEHYNKPLEIDDKARCKIISMVLFLSFIIVGMIFIKVNVTLSSVIFFTLVFDLFLLFLKSKEGGNT